MARKLSTITLYSGVEFDDTYKHVVNWDTQQQLDDFLNANKNNAEAEKIKLKIPNKDLNS